MISKNLPRKWEVKECIFGATYFTNKLQMQVTQCVNGDMVTTFI